MVNNMIIKKIDIKDKFVSVKLDKGQFQISIETYLENHLLIGEEITTKEIEKLEKKDLDNIIKSELLIKLSRKKLSKRECEEFLIDRGISEKSIKEIIDELGKNHLINDLELAEFIIDYSLMNKKGINVIKQKFNERKVSVSYQNVINDYLDREKYIENIKYLVNKYKKMNKNKSKLLLKKYLSNKMIENGYNIEEFIDFIDVDEVDESTILTKEIAKFFKNHEYSNENISKITKKLLSKGFNYDIIKKAIRECDVNETY